MFQLLFVNDTFYSIKDVSANIRYKGNLLLRYAIRNYEETDTISESPKLTKILATADSPYDFNPINFPELFI